MVAHIIALVLHMTLTLTDLGCGVLISFWVLFFYFYVDTQPHVWLGDPLAVHPGKSSALPPRPLTEIETLSPFS